jgi:hypothetical protein
LSSVMKVHCDNGAVNLKLDLTVNILSMIDLVPATGKIR